MNGYLGNEAVMNIIIVSLNPADEIFLSKEIEHLKKDNNIIFISRDRELYQNVTINSNDNIKTFIMDDPRHNKGKWLANVLLSVFKPEVWKELAYAAKNKPFSMLTVKKVLYYSAGTYIDAGSIAKILRDNNISFGDQTVLYSYRMNTGSLTIVKLRDLFKDAKCIARAHGVDLYEYRQPDNYISFRQKILKGLEVLYCISQDGKNYVEQYPFEHCRVEVSRLGTKDYGIEKDELRDNAEHIPFLVSCSRISPEKRIEKIIDALALIDEEIQWVHIGGGDTIDELKKYAHKKLGDKTNVHYSIVGDMDNEEVIRYYGDHYIDAFVNVSSVEGIPVSIMEASSFGIPAIATDVGGTSEIIKDEYNGYLLPADFSDELLASRITSFIRDTEKTEQMRKNARTEWETNYNEERNYQLFAESVFDL